jgi:hypothetical protein
MTKFARLIPVALLALALGVPALAAGEAQVRVVHASPDAPPVDVLVNDELRLFEGAAFGDITDYATVPANTYNVKVVPEGAGPGSAVIDADLNLLYFERYTVVAVNELAMIEPIVLEDPALPPLPTRARVRFLHASPDAPAVDIRVVDGPYLFQDVEFKEVGDYVTIPAGFASLEVLLAGTEQVVLSLPALQFESGTNYTAYAVGFALGGQPALTAILSEDGASLPLRFRLGGPRAAAGAGAEELREVPRGRTSIFRR